MKQIFSMTLLCVLLISCKKNETDSSSNSMSNYFNCEVDGKKINLSYTPKSVYDIANGVNGTSIYGGVSTKIGITVTSNQCSTVGSYCITSGFEIFAQKEGSYKTDNGNSFSLYTIEGADQYSYLSGAGLGSVIINIDKIVHSSVANPLPNQYGYMQGTFSGIVKKIKLNSVTNYPPLNISGNFYILIP